MIRVFLCDDVVELRALVRLTLEDEEDMEVVGEAGDGRAALDGIATAQPDIVLLDLFMPWLDGLEVLPRIRELSPQTRVVIFSGFAEGRVSEIALSKGARRFVSKSERLDALPAIIRDVAS